MTQYYVALNPLGLNFEDTECLPASYLTAKNKIENVNYKHLAYPQDTTKTTDHKPIPEKMGFFLFAF